MRFLAALPILLLATLPAAAVIMKLTRLAEVLESEQFILVAAVEKIDPEKPSAIFAVEKALKGKPPFERIPVNMTGDDEARKANDTRIILDRLDNSRKVVLFISKRGKRYNAMAFVEGTWFSLQGTIDDADKSVRWAFLHGEPYLRRTFKGTSAELVKVIEDGLAKKAKPPEPNEKEPKGYGPAVGKKEEEAGRRLGSGPGLRSGSAIDGDGPIIRLVPDLNPDLSPLLSSVSTSPTLFAVIPSFALVGPLAIVAALFPGVFARMAVGMTRWRAFLVVASLNSTLALIYFFTQKYLPNSWWFSPQAVTLTLMLITAVGLSWAGRRYRRMAAQDPRVTALPGRVELWSLVGLSLFAGACVVVTRIFASWEANLELPLREFTFIGIALLAATIYAFYRRATARLDLAGPTVPERRLSLSGETVGLGVLLLCGLVTLLNSGARPADPIASGTLSGDAETIGPRLVSARVFEISGASQVMSGLTLAGDRLYFGTDTTRLSSRDGNVFCLNRDSGEVLWKFGDDEGMLPAFCTPSLHSGKLYCGEGLHSDKNCRVFCIDAATGKPAWEKPFQTASHTEGAPAVVNGKVFVPAGDDGLFAADAGTGTRLWQFPGGKDRGIHIDAAPAVKGSRIFAGSGLYSFVAVCLDTETGNEIWRTHLKLRSFGAPIVLGQHIYFGVGTGNMLLDTFAYEEEGGLKETDPAGAVVCLDIENGQETWRYDLPRSVHTGLAGDAFSIYATSRDGYVHCLDRKTGKLRWKTGIGGPITAAPAVATASGSPVGVYAVSQEGNVACLNPHTGAVAWQRRLPAPTEKEPGFRWDGRGENGVLGGPVIATTLTDGGSRRAIFIGAMTVDPFNPAKKTAAIFRFDDEIGIE